MRAIDAVLEEISKHTIDEKEMILEIVNKRIIEEKRESIYKDYKSAVKNYKSGKVKTGTVDDLFMEIDK
jgi:hypothetical protein